MKYIEEIKVCQMVADDMENDMRDMDGKEFNGINVATLFGNQAAAIVALSNTLESLLKDLDQ